MLEAINLECVRGEQQLFAGLNMTLEPGQLLHVSGKNGSGKTSFLRILCGLHKPYSGSVQWRGRLISSYTDEFNRDLCYIGHLSGVKEELSPMENLLIASSLAGMKPGTARLLQSLDDFGILDRAELPVRYLSQGQKRRVALARLALCSTSPLWILDEPFNALDKAAVSRLRSLLAAHVLGGGMVVLTTHLEIAIDGAEPQHIDLDRPRELS